MVDVGFVVGGDYPQGRYFGNGVGIGFDAVVGFEALKLKRLSGFPSYMIAALKTIFLYFQAPEVSVQLDHQTFQLHTLMISVMNGRRMGGGFLMAPNALQDDGLLDICIAAQVSRTRILSLIPKFMRGTQASQPEITTAQSRTLKVQALDGSLPVHADGETICTHGSELSIELLHRQIEIVY
jgi:diacylglycerol kinase family enzyme